MKMPSTEHPEGLFLEYLEGALSTEEKMVVEEHLSECGDCRAMLEELRQISGQLKEERESVFCPEPWELHELAIEGREPTGRLAEHLEHCPDCARECLGYRATPQAEHMSHQVTDSFRALAARHQSRHEAQEYESITAKLTAFMSRLFRAPMLPLASVAAAAALAVVLLYPGGHIEPMVGLSDVPWRTVNAGPNGTAKSLVAVEKQRVAILLLFEGLRKRPPQKLIDSLYRELQPPDDLYGRFEFADPASVKASIGGMQIDPDNHKLLLQRLEQHLKASMALIVSVAGQKNAYRVSGQLIDTKTGDSLQRTVVSEVNDADLAATVKDSAVSLLSSNPKSR